MLRNRSRLLKSFSDYHPSRSYRGRNKRKPNRVSGHNYLHKAGRALHAKYHPLKVWSRNRNDVSQEAVLEEDFAIRFPSQYPHTHKGVTEYTKRTNYAELSFDAPHLGNALYNKNICEMLKQLREVREGRSVKAVVLRGVPLPNGPDGLRPIDPGAPNPEAYFSTGLHYETLGLLAREHQWQELDNTIRNLQRLAYFCSTSSADFLTQASLPFTVSLLDGEARGAGAALALLTDFPCCLPTTTVTLEGPEVGLPYQSGWHRILASLEGRKRNTGLAEYLLCTPGLPLYPGDLKYLGFTRLQLSRVGDDTLDDVLSHDSRWDYHTVVEAFEAASDIFGDLDYAMDQRTITPAREKWISLTFKDKKSVPEIIQALTNFAHANDKSGKPEGEPLTPAEWANATRDMIQAMSPTALSASFAIYRQTVEHNLPLSEVLKLEHRATMRLLRSQDFAVRSGEYETPVSVNPNTEEEEIPDVLGNFTQPKGTQPGKSATDELVTDSIYASREYLSDDWKPTQLPQTFQEVNQDLIGSLLSPMDGLGEDPFVDMNPHYETWRSGELALQVQRVEQDDRIDLVRGLGVDPACCHPLAGDDPAPPLTKSIGDLVNHWHDCQTGDGLVDPLRPRVADKKEKLLHWWSEVSEPFAQYKDKMSQYQGLLWLDKVEEAMDDKVVSLKLHEITPTPLLSHANRTPMERLQALCTRAAEVAEFNRYLVIPADQLSIDPNPLEKQSQKTIPLDVRVRHASMLFHETVVDTVMDAANRLKQEISENTDQSPQAVRAMLEDKILEQIDSTPDLLAPQMASGMAAYPPLPRHPVMTFELFLSKMTDSLELLPRDLPSSELKYMGRAEIGQEEDEHDLFASPTEDEQRFLAWGSRVGSDRFRAWLVMDITKPEVWMDAATLVNLDEDAEHPLREVLKRGLEMYWQMESKIGSSERDHAIASFAEEEGLAKMFSPGKMARRRYRKLRRYKLLQGLQAEFDHCYPKGQLQPPNGFDDKLALIRDMRELSAKPNGREALKAVMGPSDRDYFEGEVGRAKVLRKLFKVDGIDASEGREEVPPFERREEFRLARLLRYPASEYGYPPEPIEGDPRAQKLLARVQLRLHLQLLVRRDEMHFAQAKEYFEAWEWAYKTVEESTPTPSLEQLGVEMYRYQEERRKKGYRVNLTDPIEHLPVARDAEVWSDELLGRSPKAFPLPTTLHESVVPPLDPRRQFM